MLGERIASQSEVTRAIVAGYSPTKAMLWGPRTWLSSGSRVALCAGMFMNDMPPLAPPCRPETR